MKITIELSYLESWIIDTEQPDIAQFKEVIEQHANAIIKPLDDALTIALDEGTTTHMIELR